MHDNHFKFSPSVILLPFLSVVLLWVVFWVDIRFHLNFDQLGIYPQTASGLIGILCSPFLHGNLEHLYNNSVPLFILIAVLRYFYRDFFFKILGYGILISGFITWIIGRESYHIGASGLIYVLVSFIFFKGIITKYFRLVALSLFIVFVYGSMVWYIFPNIQEEISWEGHLAGLITGLVFAVIFKTPEYKKLIKYDWEHPEFNPDDDKFMQRFDENGNFVNLPNMEIDVDLEVEDPFFYISNPNINYEYIETKNGPKP